MIDRLRCISLSVPAAPPELLSAFRIPSIEMPGVYDALRGRGLESALVLSTCNRIEIYTVADSESELVEELAARQHRLNSSFYRHLMRLSGSEVARWLFRVTAGLESVLIGETEIQGQVRRAFEMAQACGMGGGALGKTVQAALHAGKRARTHARHSQSLANLVAEKLGAEWTLVGTGQLANEILAAAHQPPRLILSRSEERARRLAAVCGAQGNTFGAAPTGVVVWASDAVPPECLLGAGEVIDLSEPTAFPNRPGVLRLRDLLAGRASAGEADLAEALHAEWQRFRQEAASSPVRQTVSLLHQRTKNIAREQLDWAIGEMDDLTPRNQLILEALVARIVSRTLHRPITNLRASTEGQADSEVIDRLFGLVQSSETLEAEA